MDSILVVCYSHTGVSSRLARLLCAHQGWPMGKIIDPRPRGVLRCILDSLLRRHPLIRYEGPDPADFRTVVLVSPIWAYRLAGPMRSFVTQQRAALQRLAVISTMGSGGASNAVAEVATILGRAPILAQAFTQREIEDGSGTGRILAFAESLQPGKAAASAGPQPAWSGASPA